jgi:hypothetical protein
MRAVIVGAGRGGQGVQHGLHELRALRRQVPVDDARPADRSSQLHRPVIERRARVLVLVIVGLVLAGLLVHLRGQPGQVGQP